MVVLLFTVIAAIMFEQLPGYFTACIPLISLSTTSDALAFFSAVSAVSVVPHSKCL